MEADPLVLLTRDGVLERIAVSGLAARFPNLAVIVEPPVSRVSLIRGRVKRLGILHVIGQLAFIMFARLQRWTARARIAEISRTFRLAAHWPAGMVPIRVSSINSPECIGHLQRLNPRAVLVVGTRIIRANVLGALDVPFINYHDGITPKYRGIRGGYWAKVERDEENFGVSVHLIDAGIDTGAVLYQARLTASATDNYSTYPYLQIATALALLERAAQDAISGNTIPQAVNLPSRLWSHPTLWGYVWAGLRHGTW
jgi:hypothetical protein